MNIEQLGEKLEKLGKDLMPSKEAPDAGVKPDLCVDKPETAKARLDVRPDPCSKLDILADNKPETADVGVDVRPDPCSKLDILADNKPETADMGVDARLDPCSKLDILADNRPEAASLDEAEQTWLEQQPEGKPISFKGLCPVCLSGSIRCTGCAGSLMGSHLECRGGSCLGGLKHPKCHSGTRPC